MTPRRVSWRCSCCGFRPVRPRRAEEARPVTLSRGINITAWFRFPASRQPAALAGYLGDQALADLRSTGFDFVRLAVDPDVVASAADRALLVEAIRRIQRDGLAVIISPHPQGWHLETEQADRNRLCDFWRGLAPALLPLDPARTVPEVLNEPVFPGRSGRLGRVAASGAGRNPESRCRGRQSC